MKISGIYTITNKINHKVYVGQSENCYDRWIQHKTDSKYKKSPLYNDIRKYGIENFYFKIIEKMPAYLLNAREKEYIKKYNSLYPNGYNMQKGGDYYSIDYYINNNNKK